MSLYSHKEGYSMKRRKNQSMVDTIISQDTVIEGKVLHPSSLRIDGKVYGEIQCDGDVYIGKDGYVEPKLKGKNIIVAGEIKGEVYSTEKVHIQPNGKLTGDVTTKGIVIEDKGIFNGNCTIMDDVPPSTRKQNKFSVQNDMKKTVTPSH